MMQRSGTATVVSAKLTTGDKAAWDYVTSNCDNVGVWVPDL
jgi:hypothetical protein